MAVRHPTGRDTVERVRLLRAYPGVLLLGALGCTEAPAPTVPAEDASPQRDVPFDTRDKDDRPAPSLDAADALATDTTPVIDAPTRDIPRDAPRDVPRDTSAPPPPPPPVVRATNPVLAGDHPDPSVVRVVGAGGSVAYYLVATVDVGDFPIYRSTDLIHWTRLPNGAFRRGAAPGSSIEINGAHFCHLWAPSVVQVREGVFMLTFSATRFTRAQSPCPPYREDGGVYVASSVSPEGPFAIASRPWEPLPLAGALASCPADVRNSIPRSLPSASPQCQGTWCHHIVRLDGEAWRDPLTGRWWMGYAWYTNTPPRVDWERTHYGEHSSLVELDASDPFTVRCDRNVAQVFVGDSHDTATLARLRGYCARCGEMLSFTRARGGAEFNREGYTFGVVEGPALFRRGRMVYVLLSGSVWDSPYYHVFWAAAPSVEALAYDNPQRIVGRYLIPSRAMAFGHGTPVLGPDGERWYYVHHRLRANDCAARGDCARDVWVSPIEFEERGDGRGDVWIRQRFPAEASDVEVRL